MADDPGHCPQTFNSYFFPAVVRSRQKHFDPHRGPHGGTLAADDQCAIQRDVIRKATLGMLPFVNPVKDHWKSKLVSHRGPSVDPKNAFIAIVE